jgi:Rhodopirellula transposase DDE domain
VGTSADTPAWAVTARAPWWEQIGRVVYPQATQLVLVGDAGGSLGYRPQRWKAHLQSQLSDGLGLRVTGGHDPTSCSKWNPMEPRLCSPISLKWAAQPLRTLETRLGYRPDTTTTTGLQVTATRLEGVSQTGKKVTEAGLKTLEVAQHALCPPWHYPIRPRVGSALRT